VYPSSSLLTTCQSGTPSIVSFLSITGMKGIRLLYTYVVAKEETATGWSFPFAIQYWEWPLFTAGMDDTH